MKKKSFTMSGVKHNQYGTINGLVLWFIFVLLLLVGSIIFAFWAFGSRQDYKNNTNQKIASAVSLAIKQTESKDANQYALQAEQPLKTYLGPESYGSIVINYPKTWSAYINEQDGSGLPLNGYFQPNFVPSTVTQTNTFALRLQVIQESYNQALSQFASLAQQGLVTVSPYSPVKVPGVVGVKVVGQIEANVKGSMIILPLRDTTLELWTESSQNENDFNNNILPNFSFSP